MSIHYLIDSKKLSVGLLYFLQLSQEVPEKEHSQRLGLDA